MCMKWLGHGPSRPCSPGPAHPSPGGGTQAWLCCCAGRPQHSMLMACRDYENPPPHPKPRGRLFSWSYITTASSTAPNCSKCCRSASSFTEGARPPTKIFRVLLGALGSCGWPAGVSSFGTAFLASTCRCRHACEVPEQPPDSLARPHRTSLRSIVCLLATTLSATSVDSNTTKPKPRGRPVALS